MPAPLRIALSLIAFVLCCSSSRSARAHDPFEITTQGTIDADSLVLLVTMSQKTAQRIEPLDLAGDRAVPSAAAASLHSLSSGGRPLHFRGATARLTAEKDVEFRIVYDRPEAGPLRLHATYLERLEDGYGNAVTLTQGTPPTTSGLRYVDRDNPTLELPVHAGPGTRNVRSSPVEFGRFLVLGIEHLVTGYDHLLFLAGLLLAVRGFKALLALVTAFTLAHSVTLALASLDLFSIAPSVVEPLIAASIVCVGLDNLLIHDPRLGWRRLAVTVGFGLIHGFGFASVLRELGLGGEGLITVGRLLAFNLGIELGQVAVALLAVPALSYLRRRQLLDLRGYRTASVAIAASGAYWLVQRLPSL